jgi:hypothetical protein
LQHLQRIGEKAKGDKAMSIHALRGFRSAGLMLGMLTLLTTSAGGCSGDDDKKPNPTGSGGSGSGGSGSGGSGSGGSGTGGGGGASATGGTGGSNPGTGMAFVKFCNPLARNDMMPVDLTLQVGGDTTLLAASLSCAPAKGTPCRAIQPGKAVALQMFLGTMKLATEVIEVAAGEELIIHSSLDQQNFPVIDGFIIDTTMAHCQDLDFKDIFSPAPADGGSGTGGTGGGPTLPPGNGGA